VVLSGKLRSKRVRSLREEFGAVGFIRVKILISEVDSDIYPTKIGFPILKRSKKRGLEDFRLTSIFDFHIPSKNVHSLRGGHFFDLFLPSGRNALSLKKKE